MLHFSNLYFCISALCNYAGYLVFSTDARRGSFLCVCETNAGIQAERAL